MNARLMATLRLDVTLQMRNGFYLASLLVLIFWALCRLLWMDQEIDWLLPALVPANLVVNTFFFVSGLVLLEKGEGTLRAQAVTPLRQREYLAGKLISLTLLATLENLLLVALCAKGRFALLPLLVALLLTSAFFTLTGLLAVSGYQGVNEFLIPSIGYTSVLGIPLVTYLMGWQGAWLYLHPLQACLLLFEGAFRPLQHWRWLYAVVYPLLAIAGLFRLSRKRLAAEIESPEPAR